MQSPVKYKALGIMSGSSLDGVDLALCHFTYDHRGWHYRIPHAKTISYRLTWQAKLAAAHSLPGEALVHLDFTYGAYLGRLAKQFLEEHKIRGIDLIASHGHTIFHQPSRGITFQLGNGNAIRAVTGVPVIFDFRSLDVSKGGQGAPLVPVGDELLFRDYDVCLNLGGIANLSYRSGKTRMAFDICFANMGLNYLAAQTGHTFDKDGRMAAEGKVIPALCRALALRYRRVSKTRPSLGREMFELHFAPLLNERRFGIHDRLASFTESIAMAIVTALPPRKQPIRVFCTGGGAFNGFLMSRLLELGGTAVTWICPDRDTVKYKEALVFALLGVLRLRGEVNCLRSVTGASANTSGGLMI